MVDKTRELVDAIDDLRNKLIQSRDQIGDGNGIPRASIPLRWHR